MSARPAGSIATLLMSGPLIAIPLMAIFGVPEFASLTKLTDRLSAESNRSASQDVISDGTTVDDSQPSFDDWPLDQPARSPRANSQSLPDTAPRSSPVVSGPSASATSDPGDWQSEEPRAGFSSPGSITESPADKSSVTLAGFEDRPVDSVGLIGDAGSDSASEAPWESAAERLRDMGIDDYRLERGESDDSFVFICQFIHGADARIVRRFEAEAATPVDAVQQVLDQIEDWHRRTGSSFAGLR